MIKDAIKNSVVQLVRKLGFEIVPVSRLMPRDIATHLKTLFAILNITCVFDVGANTGQFADFLRDDVDYDDLIVSFEPARRTAQILRDKSRNDPNWVVYECALGAESGHKPFNVMNADTLSSFLAPDVSATDLYARYNVVDHIEDVPVRTLDSVLAELRTQRDIGRGLYLKVDTQGYDLEVLRGAAHCLAEIAAVQTELSCLQLYAQMPGYVEVLETLARQGFDLSGLFPVSQDTCLRIIEADCILTNRALMHPEHARLMWTNSV